MQTYIKIILFSLWYIVEKVLFQIKEYNTIEIMGRK
jgi:hypothetical protein